MTMQEVGANPWPVSWLGEGWAALRDKAHSALTYFGAGEEEAESGDEAGPTQRWGLVATDLIEHDDRFEIRMEIPGMAKEDLKVAISGGQIVIAGEKRAESTRRSGNAVVTERAFGSFQRALPLPMNVDPEAANARYVDGVLAIDLPTRGKAHSTRVSVD